MRLPNLDFLPPLLVAIGLLGAVGVFISETHSFRDAVVSWAKRDLQSRTKLASSTLKDAVATGDFRRIHEFGETCSNDGVRLTVFSAPGGIVFDSAAHGEAQEESIFSVQSCGEFKVRLGLPVSRVLAPYRRARFGFFLAAVVGGTGVLFIVLFTFKQRAKIRELARERDAQRRIVKEMQKIESFRRDFIADVSHEIKTPLTGIIGVVDLLSCEDNMSAEAKGKLLLMLKAESVRLNDLTQGILSLARLERDADTDNTKFASVDISRIVHDVAERLQVQAEGQCASLILNIPETCIAVCDGQLIDMAVSNLLLNAIRHSRSQEIFISVFSSGDSVSIAVEDHGVGIPERDRKRVFERFYRVDRSRDSDSGGTGLGLAIVQGIARLHGGNTVLEDSKPSGCRFILTFPRNHVQNHGIINGYGKIGFSNE